MERPTRFPQQQYKLGSSDYQSCVRIMSHEKYLNLDKLGLFFKALPEKGLAEKTKIRKRWQEIKTTYDCYVYCCFWWFFLSLNQLSFGNQNHHVALSCFNSLSPKDASRPMPVHYFSNKKAWMNTDIVESIL